LVVAASSKTTPQTRDRHILAARWGRWCEQPDRAGCVGFIVSWVGQL